MAKFFKGFQSVVQFVAQDDRGIAGFGPMSILMGISFGIILLAGVGKMTWPAAQTGLPIASYGDSFEIAGTGVIDMKAKVCRLLTPGEVFHTIAKLQENPGTLGGN